MTVSVRDSGYQIRRADFPLRRDFSGFAVVFRGTGLMFVYCASWAQRKPNPPERSMLGAIINNFPCSPSL